MIYDLVPTFVSDLGDGARASLGRSHWWSRLDLVSDPDDDKGAVGSLLIVSTLSGPA